MSYRISSLNVQSLTPAAARLHRVANLNYNYLSPRHSFLSDSSVESKFRQFHFCLVTVHRTAPAGAGIVVRVSMHWLVQVWAKRRLGLIIWKFSTSVISYKLIYFQHKLRFAKLALYTNCETINLDEKEASVFIWFIS